MSSAAVRARAETRPIMLSPRSILLPVVFCGYLLASSPAAAEATPPSQPASGPGAAQYAHAAVEEKESGEGATAYTIFLPASPKPAEAPVVVFTHGWGATDPGTYRGWIDHIVRRGNIVIFPRYQKNLRTPTADFTPNAVAAVKNALSRLSSDALGIKPRLDRVAYLGHSVGGLLAANLAALAAREGLPPPRAVMCTEPGKTTGPERARVALADLGGIPAGTLLLAVAGDADRMVGDGDARRIFAETTNIRPADKNFILMRSDDHGTPHLIADHKAPTAPSGEAGQAPERQGPFGGRLRERLEARRNADERSSSPRTGPDALDWYGTWKLFDALTDAAFYGRNRQYALGNTGEQRFMGVWSDGQPVRDLAVTLAP